MLELLQLDQTANTWMNPSEETWRRLHEEAVACQDVEQSIRIGLAVLTFIDARQMDLAAQCAAGNSEPDAEIDDAVKEAYRLWMRTADEYLVAMRNYIERGYGLDAEGEFRQACARVRSLLTLWSRPANRPLKKGSSLGALRARIQRKL